MVPPQTMPSTRTEIEIRDKTKKVLKCLQEEDYESARKIVLKYREVLRYNLGLANFVPLIPRIRFSKIIPKNLNALRMVIETGFQIYVEDDNVDELLFFAAAKCDLEKLNYCVQQILNRKPEGINQTREGDTALLFLIKYGNLADENYSKCVKILVDAGIDVNRNDYFFHNPIAFLISLYKRHKTKTHTDDVIINNLRQSIDLLLKTKTIDLSAVQSDKELLEEFQFDDCHKPEFSKEEEVDHLFKLLINKDEENFKKSKKVLHHLDADDGHNTFLQLCCEKNLKEAATFLIKKGADLSKVTERNPKTPLELAARRNHHEIFEAILHENKVIIDDNLFMMFLRNRPKHIKAKYFDEILKYKHLDLNIRSNNGNTPLHYAIIFSSSEAIEVLLGRGASLTVKNDSGKTPLDYINAEDLEAHLNKCVIRDSYTDINHGKYELALNYHNLIETEHEEVVSEISILKKICSSSSLCHLTNHPLVASFIDVKWKLAAPIYRGLFIFQLLFYLVTIFSYFNLNILNYLGEALVIVYTIRISAFFNWNNKLHEIVDIMIVLVIFLSTLVDSNGVKYQLGVLVTIFMAFSFHLFWRFSPKFSEFHAVLINIISHIFSFLLYTFVLTLFFGAAYYIFILVNYEDSSKNVVIPHDLKSIISHFYLLCALGVFISILVVLTIINSFIYLQENFSENIRNNFKISGYRNVLIFLESVERFYKNYKIFGSVLHNPFIFDETDLQHQEQGVNKKKQKKNSKNRNRFLINFYVNANKFSFEKLLSVKLDDVNSLKLKRMTVNQ